MTRPLLLDLFCGAGGASMGYHRAGFEVVGVDIGYQPRYPFDFYRADAMEFPLDGLDGLDGLAAIHASPPCQAYSSATKAWGRTGDHQDLYDAVRRRLIDFGLPWVIENVEGAPVHHGARLCGSMFGLDIRRHRTFESSVLMMLDRECRHPRDSVITVTGHMPQRWEGGERRAAPRSEVEAAMGIDWMRPAELVEAVPPAYTEWIGERLLDAIGWELPPPSRFLRLDADGLAPPLDGGDWGMVGP